MNQDEALVAVVTGGATGLGEAISHRLARDGYHVVVADVNLAGAEAVADAIRAEGGAAIALPCDVSDPDEVEALLDEAARWSPRLKVMVNNAGMARSGGVLDGSIDDWNRVMSVNVNGVFHGVRAAARRMVAAGEGGSIVNVSSISGYRASSVSQVAYDTSKAAVRMLTVSASAELATLGVRVNAVAPGATATNMVVTQLNTPAKLANSVAKIPLGRLGQPEEIAAAVAFLASEEASYVSGHTLVVDGGRMTI